MQGLTLARLFYQDVAAPRMQQKLGSQFQRLAIGLVGEGSECFGFDDKHSRDHDFGAGFCVWALQEDKEALAPALEAIFAALPRTFMGFSVRLGLQSHEYAENGAQRMGLFSVEEFYQRFTHGTKAPQTWQEWYMLPEHFLAVCTNGEVFYDGLGTFSAFRTHLLHFYPEDVRKKKLAARLSVMAQSGQYNLLRQLQRGEGASAALACARFVENALAAYFLIHKRYMPFYKWAFKALAKLPQGQEFSALLYDVLQYNMLEITSNAHLKDDFERRIALVSQSVEKVCLHLVQLLQEQGLSPLHEPWLMAQAQYIQSSIELTQLQSLPISHGVSYS